jgi:hypothetical protein
MPSEHSEIEVHVEFDEFIAGRELSEILELLDAALWYEVVEEFDFPPFHFRYQYSRGFEGPPPALFCLTGC